MRVKQEQKQDVKVLRGPVECDVCVIGGGLAGLSTAISLAERGQRCSACSRTRLRRSCHLTWRHRSPISCAHAAPVRFAEQPAQARPSFPVARSVVLLEKNRVGWSASGRNGGMAIAGFQIDGARQVMCPSSFGLSGCTPNALTAAACVPRLCCRRRLPCDACSRCAAMEVLEAVGGDEATAKKMIATSVEAQALLRQRIQKHRCARPGS